MSIKDKKRILTDYYRCIKPRPADRRKEIRDKKLVGMKPHRLVVRLPDGRSGGARRKPLPNCRLQDTYSSTGA